MEPERERDRRPEATSRRLSYEQLRATLARFEYFRHWSEDQVRECSVLAQVVQYAPQQTIPLERPLPFAFLVLSGQCMILQCLPLVRGPRGRLQLAPPDDEGRASPPPAASPTGQIQRWHETFAARIAATTTATPPPAPFDPSGTVAFVQTPPPGRRVAHHFLDVGTLRCGAVFGLGERHQQRTVVARGRTQCLLIPRCWLLLKRQNVGNTWARLRMYLDWALPTRDELLVQLVGRRAWLRYRERLVREAAKRPSRTLPSDVPIVCRLAESTMPGPPLRTGVRSESDA